jgi:hypothetical protein
MMNLYRFSVGLVMFFFLGQSQLAGQFNIKVGYAGSFPQDSKLNMLIDQFNANQGKKLEDNMDRFSSYHGLTLGLRYRLNRIGIEASWQSLSSKSDFIGNIQSTRVSDKWFVSDTDYSLGIENYWGRFGYGASFGYSTLRIKTDISGSSRKKRTVNKDTSPFGRVFLILQMPSKNVAAVIKPYIQFPLGNGYDISSFYNDFYSTYDPSLPQSTALFMKNTSFGINVALYNGPQE